MAATRLYNLATRFEDREFEKLACEMLRLGYPNLVPSQPLRSLDRRGVDLVVFKEGPAAEFPIAVQCKGFQVTEGDFGAPQVRQCLKSITRFRESGLRAERYVLAINRSIENPKYRTKLLESVGALEADGLVKHAELLDVKELIARTFAGAMGIALVSLDALSTRLCGERLQRLSSICEPLESVPLTVQYAETDQHRLRGISPAEPVMSITDPLQYIPATSIVVFVGEAGAGKTTLAQRLLAAGGRKLAYLPAAAISLRTIGANDLLEHLQLKALLKEEGVRSELAREASRSVLDYLLKDPKQPLVLFIDAIDESIYLSRRGGLQTLLNQLRAVRVPTVITVRAELWRECLPDFASAFGAASADDSAVHIRRTPIVSLLDWTDAHIAEAVRRRISETPSGVAASHLTSFLAIIEDGTYREYYGTIPRTPLFLRFVLDTVEEHGARPAKRADLVDEWVRKKITRDVQEPLMFGDGREPLIEGIQRIGTTIDYAFDMMEMAASIMLVRSKGQATIELIGRCSFDELKSAFAPLANVMDPVGITLNTLLVPATRPGRHIPDLQFCHRIFQEYFLARDVLRRPALYAGFELPSEVVHWQAELRSLTNRP